VSTTSGTSTRDASGIFTGRLTRLAELAREEGLAAIVVASDWRYRGNLRFFTDRVLWSRWAYIVVRPDRPPVLVCVSPSQRYWAIREGAIEDVRFAHHAPITEVISLLRESAAVGEKVGIAGLDEIMRPADFETLQRTFPKVDFIDVSPLVNAMRTPKTPEEVDAARRTMRIAEQAYALFCDRLAPGRSHWEIVGEVERILRGSGSYDTMILLSTGAYLREPGPGTFSVGDTVMFSIELAGPEGYWIERGGTLFIGEPDDNVRRLYQACYEGVKAAESLIRHGATALEITEGVDGVLAASGYTKGIWGGHGIGLDVLEHPILLPDSGETVEAPSLIAYHPHILDPDADIGAYISDTYAVTETETIPLAEIPHELTCVQA
jgi:Xaa-Pro aminopeptidase